MPAYRLTPSALLPADAASSDNPTPSAAWREIPLKGGAIALVDAADYDRVRPFRWRVSRDGYAVAWGTQGKKLVSMHRLILGLVGASRSVFVDHVAGPTSRLDNRRENIRITDSSGNQANRQTVRSRTGYKGATLHRGTGKYQAACKKHGKNHHAGLHATALDAAVAYWRKAQELHGPMAWTTDEVRAEAERRAQEAQRAAEGQQEAAA